MTPRALVRTAAPCSRAVPARTMPQHPRQTPLRAPGGTPQDGGAKQCIWNAFLRFFQRSSAEDMLVAINSSWGDETADLHLRMLWWTPGRTKGDLQPSHPRVPLYRAVASQHAALAPHRQAERPRPSAPVSARCAPLASPDAPPGSAAPGAGRATGPDESQPCPVALQGYRADRRSPRSPHVTA